MGPESVQAYRGKEDFGITERGMALQNANSEKMLANEKEKTKESDLLMKEIEEQRNAFNKLDFLTKDVEAVQGRELKERSKVEGYFEQVGSDMLANKNGILSVMNDYEQAVTQSEEYLRGQNNAINMQAAQTALEAGRIMKEVEVNIHGEMRTVPWFDAVALHGQGLIKDIPNNGAFDVMPLEEMIKIIQSDTDPDDWDGPQLDRQGFREVYRSLNPKAEQWYVDQMTDWYVNDVYVDGDDYDRNNPFHLGENTSAKRNDLQRQGWGLKNKQKTQYYSKAAENFFGYNFATNKKTATDAVEGTPIDLNGPLAGSQIKTGYGSVSPKSVMASRSPTNALVKMNLDNGGGDKLYPLNFDKGSATYPWLDSSLADPLKAQGDSLHLALNSATNPTKPKINGVNVDLSSNHGGRINIEIPEDVYNSPNGGQIGFLIAEGNLNSFVRKEELQLSDTTLVNEGMPVILVEGELVESGRTRNQSRVKIPMYVNISAGYANTIRIEAQKQITGAAGSNTLIENQQ